MSPRRLKAKLADPVDFAPMIEAVREAGLTHEEIAAIVGVSVNVINRASASVAPAGWEHGVRMARLYQEVVK